MRNLCGKTRKVNKPYEIWATPDNQWKWLVLKKWQANDSKPFARWFCAVQSPFTGAGYDMGDCYVEDIKARAVCTWRDTSVAVAGAAATIEKKLKPELATVAELATVLQLIVDANGDIYTDAPEMRDSVNKMRGYILAAETLLEKQSRPPVQEVSSVANEVWGGGR